MRRFLVLTLLVACGGSDADPASDTDPTGTTADTDAGDTDPGTTDPVEVVSCDGVTPVVTELTVEELHAMMESKDFDLVNVHVPYAGEIVGTDAHVAYTETDALEAELGGEKGRKAVLYCLTGPMSAIATADLASRGYCNLYDLPDGMVAWEAAGYPFEE